MTLTESLPLLVLALLLIAVGGGAVEQLDVTVDGEHEVDRIDDVLVVAGGESTIPSDAAVSGDLYVVGGDALVAGELDGDVTVLAGNLTVAAGGTVTGTIQELSGRTTVEPGASVGEVSTLRPTVPDPSPARQVGTLLAQVLVLGAIGWWLARRHPALLENVGHAVGEHTVVSGVVGALASVSLLVLFVYMAFTLLLLPVTLLGLVAEFLVVVYGQVGIGHRLGTRLPIRREGPATAVGIAVLLLALEVLGRVALVGALFQLGVLVVGFGAVVVTFFGLQRFEPARIPEGPA